MLLYIVQHAEAMSKEKDSARGLSEKGFQDIKKVAAYAAELNIKVKKVFHSGKKRALQTAQVLADYLKIEKAISETDGLAPMDDPQIWFERISKMDEDIFLVGHLPYLGKFASLILCGDMEKNVVDFRMGGIVCLKRLEDGNWSLEWMVTPDVLK